MVGPKCPEAVEQHVDVKCFVKISAFFLCLSQDLFVLDTQTLLTIFLLFQCMLDVVLQYIEVRLVH